MLENSLSTVWALGIHLWSLIPSLSGISPAPDSILLSRLAWPGTGCVEQVGLKLEMTFLLLPPKYWDYRKIPQHWAPHFAFFNLVSWDQLQNLSSKQQLAIWFIENMNAEIPWLGWGRGEAWHPLHIATPHPPELPLGLLPWNQRFDRYLLLQASMLGLLADAHPG